MLKGSLAGTKCSTPGSLVRPVFLTFFAFLFGKSRGPNYRYSTALACYNAIISRWLSGDAFRGRGARTSGCSWYFRASLFLFFFMELCSFLLSTWSSSLASTVLVKTFILLLEPFQSPCHILPLYHGVGQSTSSFFHYRISNFTLLIKRSAGG